MVPLNSDFKLDCITFSSVLVMLDWYIVDGMLKTFRGFGIVTIVAFFQDFGK